jgi:hypothetical protein
VHVHSIVSCWTHEHLKVLQHLATICVCTQLCPAGLTSTSKYCDILPRLSSSCRSNESSHKITRNHTHTHTLVHADIHTNARTYARTHTHRDGPRLAYLHFKCVLQRLLVQQQIKGACAQGTHLTQHDVLTHARAVVALPKRGSPAQFQNMSGKRVMIRALTPVQLSRSPNVAALHSFNHDCETCDNKDNLARAVVALPKRGSPAQF